MNQTKFIQFSKSLKSLSQNRKKFVIKRYSFDLSSNNKSNSLKTYLKGSPQRRQTITLISGVGADLVSNMGATDSFVVLCWIDSTRELRPSRTA